MPTQVDLRYLNDAELNRNLQVRFRKVFIRCCEALWLSG